MKLHLILTIKYCCGLDSEKIIMFLFLAIIDQFENYLLMLCDEVVSNLRKCNAGNNLL